MDKVVISDLRSDTCYVPDMMVKDGESIGVDSSRSGVITLILRLSVPILTDEIVPDKMVIGGKPIGEDELEEFRKRLTDLKPADFGT